MSYWSVGLSQDPGETLTNMDQQSRAMEEMGAKASSAEGMRSAAVPFPTLENIQATYEAGETDTAKELIKQACCVECSAGMPPIEGVHLLSVAAQFGDLESVRYLLKEAFIAVPHEPSSSHPAIVAAHYGYSCLVKELLDSIPGPCVRRDLVNWMLATSCQQGHMDIVQLLVSSYNADAKDCAVNSNEFAVITGMPLYAAAQAGGDTLT